MRFALLPHLSWAGAGGQQIRSKGTSRLGRMKNESAIQQCGGVHEVRRGETFRERGVDGGQFGAGLVVATLPLPEPRQARRGPQLQRLRLLTAGDRDGLTDPSLGLRRILRIKGQQELPLESVQFRLEVMDPSLLLER